MSDHGYVYVFVRNDLSYAQKAVQSAHAAVEACRWYLDEDLPHPSIIILVVKNEAKLKKVEEEIKNMEGGVFHYEAFREPDMGNEMTAIATGPLYGDQRDMFKRYQLLKE